MREIQSFINYWEIALFMSLGLPLGLPASDTRHGVGAVNDVLNNAPSCVWHAHHFNPFTLLKHINWEKFNSLFILMRNHPQTEEPSGASVTRHPHCDMWHDASVTRHPHCDMWHGASVTRQIIMHLLPCSNHLDYILSRVTTSRDSCCHWSDKYVHHIRLYLKKS